MRRSLFLLPVLAAAIALPLAHADDDHRRGGKRKEVFWDGPCKVTREWRKDGEFREKRECKPAAGRVAYVYPPWMLEQGGEHHYKPQYRPAVVPGTHRCNSAAVGQVLGSIVGGVLGHQIGQGDGRTLATVGGAVAGVLVGGEIGRRVDLQNQACLGEVLEIAPVNARVQWAHGPVHYVAVPGEIQYLQGSYCRPYRLEVKTERGWQRTGGTACRRPDGVWVAH